MALGDLFRGVFQFGEPAAMNRVTGTPEHLTVDVSAGSYDVPASWANCKGISCDTSGIIKIDKENPLDGGIDTEVLQIEAGTILQLTFVKKVYQYYVGTTACTATVWKDDGSAQVAGIKLRR